MEPGKDKLLTQYNESARICGLVFNDILHEIKNGNTNVKDLCSFGNRRITQECDLVYKKEKCKGIAFPVSISLNNCVGNYIYEESKMDKSYEKYNNIQATDVIKIELGVNIGGCIAVLGETVTSQDNQEYSKYINLLGDLQKCVVGLIKAGETNDEVRLHVESICTENDCFPVENSVGYQQLEGQLQTPDSKYIVLNHQKYYDDEDNLAVEENLCFEFEEGEVYTVNLTIIPNGKDGIETHYKELHDPHICRFNLYRYSLKLKSSREFYSKVKNEHGNNAFSVVEYKQDVKNRMGIKECTENGLLEEYPVLYSKGQLPVFHKKFTLIVMKEKCLMLKY
jgi:methionine aminopeptidase